MLKEERRQSKRTTDVFPVSVVVDESPNLEASSVNYSADGVLLMARGSLHLLVTIKGQKYRGRLASAFPTADGMTGYAVELKEPVEIAETPFRTGVPAEA